jgi:hypothetical protein
MRDERRTLRRMLGDMGRARTDHRTARSAGAQFCQGHPYRHSSTLFQGFDAPREEEDRRPIGGICYPVRSRTFV